MGISIILNYLLSVSLSVEYIYLDKPNKLSLNQRPLLPRTRVVTRHYGPLRHVVAVHRTDHDLPVGGTAEMTVRIDNRPLVRLAQERGAWQKRQRNQRRDEEPKLFVPHIGDC